MTSEYPINRLTNPNPVYKSLTHVTISKLADERQSLSPKYNRESYEE
jgi:hypothetical protein